MLIFTSSGTGHLCRFGDWLERSWIKQKIANVAIFDPKKPL
jgi:hypothetical protein